MNDSFIIYSSSVDNMNGDTVEFYLYDGQPLNCIYSVAQKDCFFNTFNNIGNEILFLISDKVCRYTNGDFKELFSIQHPNLGGQIWGRNEKDMFVRMKDGLAHYNGENLEYLYTFTSTWTSILWNAAIFEKEVFFLVSDYQNNVFFVLRGKLKN